MSGAVEWDGLLRAGAAVFTRPSFLLFWTLVSAWVLCPGRRTVTRMIGVAAPEGEHAHDAYHRFLRAGAWTMAKLWQVLRGLLVTRLAPTGILHVDLDDTLFHKAGRKIDGAGIFRDPVRSTARTVVYALGLNVVGPALRQTLMTTNMLESVFSRVEQRTGKVDPWRSSDQKQRWLAAALLDIEPRLRRVRGYRALPQLREALQKQRGGADCARRQAVAS